MPRSLKTEDELTTAINTLLARLYALQDKTAEQEVAANSVKIKIYESALQNAVREVFGQDSPEFQEYGHLTMLHGPLRVGITKSELLECRMKGLEYMKAVLAELVGRLQEKMRLLGEQPSSPRPGNLHPRIQAATEDLLANGHAWEAVFAGGKALILLVKELSGRLDLEGVALMRSVFSKNNPVLRFNQLSSATDLDEQEGMMHLYEGAVMALRNPGGHAFPTGPQSRALQYIQFLSLLAERAEEAQK